MDVKLGKSKKMPWALQLQQDIYFMELDLTIPCKLKKQISLFYSYLKL